MSDPIITPATDAVIASAAGKTAFWAGITSGVSGLLGSIDWLSISGFLLAAVSAYVSYMFKRAQARRDVDFKDRQLALEREYRQRADEREQKAADDAHAEHLVRLKQMELEGQMSRAVGMSSAQVDE